MIPLGLKMEKNVFFSISRWDVLSFFVFLRVCNVCVSFLLSLVSFRLSVCSYRIVLCFAFFVFFFFFSCHISNVILMKQLNCSKQISIFAGIFERNLKTKPEKSVLDCTLCVYKCNLVIEFSFVCFFFVLKAVCVLSSINVVMFCST